MSTVHITPIEDSIYHEFTDDCACGPAQEPLTDGIWLAIHRALDGRPQFSYTLVDEDDKTVTLLTGDPEPGWEAYDPEQEIAMRDMS